MKIVIAVRIYNKETLVIRGIHNTPIALCKNLREKAEKNVSLKCQSYYLCYNVYYLY